VPIDEPQQMRLRNLIFQAEVVEQRFGSGVLSHHDQRISENGDSAKHGKEITPPLLPSPRFCHLSSP
jgi:hypothetical protein